MVNQSVKSPAMECALVICAQVPVPGKVKTAFLPHLTPAQSAAVYRRFLADLFDTMQNIEGADFFLAYSPKGRKAFGSLVPSPFNVFFQEGRECGQRLGKIFDRLAKKNYQRIIVLNSDNPDLPTCLLHQADEALARGKTDMVLGPNERGGFYLIGLNRPYPGLFDGGIWNSPQVADTALRRAASLGLKTLRLPAWYDIDTIDDLRRHLNYCGLRRGSTSHSLSQTGQYLLKIKDRISSDLAQRDL